MVISITQVLAGRLPCIACEQVPISGHSRDSVPKLRAYPQVTDPMKNELWSRWLRLYFVGAEGKTTYENVKIYWL